jgi:hypothetical protein
MIEREAVARLSDNLAQLAEVAKGNPLRLGVADVPGRYRWGSVAAGSIEMVQWIRLAWNNRHEIVQALRETGR